MTFLTLLQVLAPLEGEISVPGAAKSDDELSTLDEPVKETIVSHLSLPSPFCLSVFLHVLCVIACVCVQIIVCILTLICMYICMRVHTFAKLYVLIYMKMVLIKLSFKKMQFQ